MIYPPELEPVGEDKVVLPSGREVLIPKAAPTFQPWLDEPMKETFGGKPSLDWDGSSAFAEVAILRLFQKADWSGRWIETYGAGSMNPFRWSDWNGDLRPAKQTVVPITEPHLNELLGKIAKQNGNTFAGCWDVFAWKDDAVIFAEGKNGGKDGILDTQRRWLDAALTVGLTEESFLIVEWGPAK